VNSEERAFSTAGLNVFFPEIILRCYARSGSGRKKQLRFSTPPTRLVYHSSLTSITKERYVYVPPLFLPQGGSIGMHH
jgi:hypothetical protein